MNLLVVLVFLVMVVLLDVCRCGVLLNVYGGVGGVGGWRLWCGNVRRCGGGAIGGCGVAAGGDGTQFRGGGVAGGCGGLLVMV